MAIPSQQQVDKQQQERSTQDTSCAKQQQQQQEEEAGRPQRAPSVGAKSGAGGKARTVRIKKPTDLGAAGAPKKEKEKEKEPQQ